MQIFISIPGLVVATPPISVIGRVWYKRTESLGVYVALRGSLDKEVPGYFSHVYTCELYRELA